MGIELIGGGRGDGDKEGCWIEEGGDSKEGWSGMVGM